MNQNIMYDDEIIIFILWNYDLHKKIIIVGLCKYFYGKIFKYKHL